MKKKLFYLIFIFMVMFAFSMSVSAKVTIGTCNYIQTYNAKNDGNYHNLTWSLWDNGKLHLKYGSYNSDVSKVNSSDIQNSGVCPKYFGMNVGPLGGFDKGSFSNNASTISSYNYGYTLEQTPATSCQYDIPYKDKGSSNTYVRFKLYRKENGSFVYMYYLNESNSFSSLGRNNIESGQDIKYFTGTIKDNVVTYNLNDSGTVHLKYSTLYASASLLSDTMSSGTCPNFTYNFDGDNLILNLDSIYSGNEPTLRSSYKVNNGNTTEEHQDENQSSGSGNSVLCSYNGTYHPSGDSSKGTFSYNFEILKDNSTNTKYFCVQIDQKRCSKSLNSGVELSIDGQNKSSFYLDSNLKNYLNGYFEQNNTCPVKETMHMYYKDLTYYFSNTASGIDNSSSTLNDGEIDDPSGTTQTAIREAEAREADQEGTDVSGCEGLIGPNVLGFLKLIRNFIMIAGPILALVLGTYDLVVALAGGDDEAKKKGIKKMKGRLIAAVLLLLIPYILVLILNIINNSSIDPSCIIN